MKKLIITLLGVLTLSVILTGLWVKFLRDDVAFEKTKNEKTCAERDKYVNLYNGKSELADSLAMANLVLYSQKQLTLVMNYRDSALNTYPYHPGDIALMKPDSSRVLIEDVIVGGGRFNYYVECVVRKRGGARG